MKTPKYFRACLKCNLLNLYLSQRKYLNSCSEKLKHAFHAQNTLSICLTIALIMKQMRYYTYITELVYSAIYSGLPNMYKKQMFELFQQKTAIWTGKKGSLD
jgi:hypothetical protein